jgi:hypothetical protein
VLFATNIAEAWSSTQPTRPGPPLPITALGCVAEDAAFLFVFPTIVRVFLQDTWVNVIANRLATLLCSMSPPETRQGVRKIQKPSHQVNPWTFTHSASSISALLESSRTTKNIPSPVVDEP